MTGIEGIYYDGMSARGIPARLHIGDAAEIELVTDEKRERFLLAAVTVSSRIGDTPRHITMPDGGKFETGDNAAVDALLARHKRAGGSRLAHWLESRWQAVLLASVVTVVFVHLLLNYGAPFLAKHIAASLPDVVETTLGEKSVATMDKIKLVTPSELPAAEKERVTRMFAEMKGRIKGVDTKNYRIIFRASKRLGPQALAFPSGIVMVTDDIVRLLEDERELTAVLAHEIGHGVHQHGLRRLIQNSAIAIFFDQLLGDSTSLAALAAGLPVFMIEMKHSRAFELEADRFAAEFMADAGLDPGWLSKGLERLTTEHDGEVATSFLSSHPGLNERAAAIEKVER